MAKTQTQELTEAVQLYLDLMYDCDVAKFDRVFASTSQLHGFRDGKMTCWPTAQYKEVLAGRKSPKALGAPREEQLLLLDAASPTQALAKVRVRINAKLVRAADRAIVAGDTFENLIRSESTDLHAIVLAFDESLGKTLRRVVEWTLRAAGPLRRAPAAAS